MSNIGDLRAIAQSIKDVATSRRRPLKQTEIEEAKTVFGASIIYDTIFIADKLGYNNRQFTMLDKQGMWARDKFVLFMGKAIFDNDASLDWPTFIHEMTHAWQGQNHVISSGYMLDSVIAQGIEGDSAYNYTVGQMWGDYNVEQQAHLVEDWYAIDKKSISCRRYYYIENCIRKPWRAWTSDIFVNIVGGAASVKG